MFASNTSAANGAATYIEDMFSTYLYTGNGSTQTITNGIDLAGKGGLVWIKSRNIDQNHLLYDTARGVLKNIQTNNTGAQQTSPAGNDLTTFGASGFSLGTDYWGSNSSGINYASWTFREQPKFFDVVTYTGNGTNGRAINHALASAPGCIIVKRTDSTSDWAVYHQALGTGNATLTFLNLTNAADTPNQDYFGNGVSVVAPTSTQFTVGSMNNVNGATYVAYLFAHNAGGFGLTGTDNVISCGSYTGNGTTSNTVTLGYEPQWVLVKIASGGTSNWQLMDNMRGMPVGSVDARLLPNSSAAEDSSFDYISPTATGFQLTNSATAVNANGAEYIYIAIRRGPMKTPTSGTSVFTPTAYTGNGAGTRLITAGFPPDVFIPRVRTGSYGYNTWVVSRLQGGGQTMAFNAQFQEQAYDTGSFTREQLGYVTRTSTNIANPADDSMIGYSIRRAPSFADVVCWQGNGSAADVNHNLGVKPQMILAKNRGNSSNWFVLVGGAGRFSINNTAAAGFDLGGTDCYGSTATTFNTAWVQDVSSNAPTVNLQQYVAYLFASCPGVSKVGSYTGNGSTQTIDCGFTGGARFVLIKSTNVSGDWWVFDTARGITSTSDAGLMLNTAGAEIVDEFGIDPATGGFAVKQSGGTLNNSGTNYIYLAIA